MSEVGLIGYMLVGIHKCMRQRQGGQGVYIIVYGEGGSGGYIVYGEGGHLGLTYESARVRLSGRVYTLLCTTRGVTWAFISLSGRVDLLQIVIMMVLACVSAFKPANNIYGYMLIRRGRG